MTRTIRATRIMRATRAPAAAAAALATIALLTVVAPAGAHARLEESTPEAGEVLSAAPASVTLTFSQEIQKITGTYGIDVLDEAGQDVAAGDAVLDDDDRSIMTVDLRPGLPPGRYVVRYKNVSDVDGDPWEGAFAFYVGRQPMPEEQALDEELAAQEEEETPTPVAATPTRPAAEDTPAGAATATAAAPVDAADDDDDTGGNLLVFFVVGAILLLGGLVVAGFIAFSRGRPAA